MIYKEKAVLFIKLDVFTWQILSWKTIWSISDLVII